MSETLSREKLAKIVRTRLEHLSENFTKGKRAVIRFEAEAVEQVINSWPRSALASEYKVAKVNGRHVIKLRHFNIVVAEFADNTASAVDFFTDILGT